MCWTALKWATFCRRTDDPKLAHIEHLLDVANIPNRRNGKSFHAPILEVDADRQDEAWALLTLELDETPDDDEQFSGAEAIRDDYRADLAEEAAQGDTLRRAGLNHRGEP